MKIVINRDFQDTTQTLGTCTVYDGDKPVFNAMSLERGDNNNQRNISCIPVGTYQVKLEWSNRFKKNLWEIKKVPNRSECKFHSANFWFQLAGCIALGQKLKDINNDGYQDVTNSRITMRAFHQALKGHKEATLIIKKCECD